MTDEEHREDMDHEHHEAQEGESPLASRLFFGAIALMSVAFLVFMLWPRQDTSSPESKEYVQWYNLGYETGAPIGRSVAESKQPAPSPKEITEMAVSKRKAAGATNTNQSAAYERGFAFGYTDGFRGIRSPGF